MPNILVEGDVYLVFLNYTPIFCAEGLGFCLMTKFYRTKLPRP